MKRTVLILATLLVVLSLGAKPVTYTWWWSTDDASITKYRVRVDDEPWVYLDKDVSHWTSKPYEDGVEHQFSLSQSYDGTHFGRSAITSTSQAEKRPWSDPTVTACNPFRLSFALSGGANYLLTNGTHPLTNQVTNIQSGLEITVHNLLPFGKHQGISVEIQAGYEPYPMENWTEAFQTTWKQALSFSGIVSYEYALPSWSFSAGAGGFLFCPIKEGSFIDSDTLFYGIVGDVRASYTFAKRWFVGASASFRYYLYSFYLRETNYGANKGPGAMTMATTLFFGVKI